VRPRHVHRARTEGIFANGFLRRRTRLLALAVVVLVSVLAVFSTHRELSLEEKGLERNILSLARRKYKSNEEERHPGPLERPRPSVIYMPGKSSKWSAQLTVINLTNRVALYNFLSTFSGTHYVTPRALTAQVGFNF